uniref:6-bladed beta-propeller n=1 Tax=Eiseniibacteriota bacterium TaxID=2212470 RepID=A0A832MLS0_UNCEI
MGARRILVAAAAALAAGALALAGCGTTFDLPTQSGGRVIPPDGSYQFQAAWEGMAGVQDVLLTQGAGAQLFVLFNYGGAGFAPRGEVAEYVLVRPERYANRPFAGLFNPVALAAGNNRVFVLDAGDTCLARRNPATQACDDTTGGWRLGISDPDRYWQVREYDVIGRGLGQFTDTTLAGVTGIAADAQGNVYVGGRAIIVLVNQDDSRLRYRLFQWRIYKYARGLRPDGKVDLNVLPPGAWHRDTTFVIEEGSGIGSVVEPRGLHWNAGGGNALYAADFGKNWVQKLADQGIGVGYFQLDGAQTDTLLQGPNDVYADENGYIVLVDGGHRRVLRYGPGGQYIQRVNTEGPPLVEPVAVASNDSLAFVADRGAARILRYKRRQ